MKEKPLSGVVEVPEEFRKEVAWRVIGEAGFRYEEIEREGREASNVIEKARSEAFHSLDEEREKRADELMSKMNSLPRSIPPPLGGLLGKPFER